LHAKVVQTLDKTKFNAQYIGRISTN